MKSHITPIHPWYNPSIISTWRASGQGAALARLLLRNRPLLDVELFEVDVVSMIESLTLDVIDTFLQCENLRIVADEKRGNDEVTLEVELEDIDDLVTEELAEIYATQGLVDEAKSIYVKLSLRNSEKSVYFAELIAKLETEQENI